MRFFVSFFVVNCFILAFHATLRFWRIKMNIYHSVNNNIITTNIQITKDLVYNRHACRQQRL